ncbi:GGDEF domain-containing protein [Sphingomonas sp. MMS24-JH45]
MSADFKAVNDRYGHATGDVVLRRVGGAVVAAIRSADRVGRFGGEEFLLIMQGADAAAAMAVTERVRAAVAGQVLAADEPVTISIGLAMAQADDGADTLIDRGRPRALRGEGGGAEPGARGGGLTVQLPVLPLR